MRKLICLFKGHVWSFGTTQKICTRCEKTVELTRDELLQQELDVITKAYKDAT